MRAVADIPIRLATKDRPLIAYDVPMLRKGQIYVTELPSQSPIGMAWSWRVANQRKDSRIHLIGSRQVLKVERQDLFAFNWIPVHLSGETDDLRGIIRKIISNLLMPPGAWLVPDVTSAIGGELCLDPSELTVRPGATSPAWTQSLSALTGQVYFSCDMHVHVPASAGTPWAAVGIMDASELAARTLPGDGSSVAVRRTGVSIQIARAGTIVDGYLSFGVHRRVDFRVDVPSRSVWVRTTTPYTWSGPWTVPGSGALYVAGYMDHGVAGHLRLITSADDLTWHDAYPTGYSPGWTDP